jgi:hypothetical protein
LDIANILGSISSAIAVTKELVQIDKAFDEAQWKLKLAELTTALADAKIGLAELRDEIQARDAEIAKLQKAFAFQGECIRVGDDIYEQRDGKPVGMPFCPRCHGVDGVFVKLVETIEQGRPAKCPNCKGNLGRKGRYLYPDGN